MPKYISATDFSYYNHDQGKTVTPSAPVELTLDGWVESQLAAKLITELPDPDAEAKTAAKGK